MDAGIAALLGAVVGGLLGAGGTLGAAALTARTQGQSQHAQWRREGRRNSYSAFIATVKAHQTAADDLMSLMDEVPLHQTRIAAALERVKSLLPAVSSAAPVIAVEGPADMGAIAEQIARHAENLTVCLELWMSEVPSGSGQPSTFANMAHGHIVDINRRLDNYTALARAALDATDRV
ncbi:hypothetical protein OG948_59205 (plasmid) [Embleya sp. NBC_00888]|uniref:hypothetical protein n=1 Tax=Embleya sp. NBC_00888 TaxID=2975960 RepID=UPI002F9103A9|nr:hypothetical protein OG948_59205 [Embleya sp. NBC_00888]